MESSTVTKPTSVASRLAGFLARPGYTETLVFAAAVLAFVGTWQYGFVYDDRAQILSNRDITTWHRVMGYFFRDIWGNLDPSTPRNYYRPMFFVWLRLNRIFFNLNPIGWHMAVMVLHALASVLATLVVRRCTRDHLVGAVSGLLFAVHPIHIESVAWVSGGTDPLLAVFFLSAILSFLSWMERGSPWQLLATAALYALALLSKEPAVVLPPLLAVIVWVCARPENKMTRAKALLWGLLPLIVESAGYFAVRARFLRGAAHSLNATPVWVMALTMPKILLFYLRQSLVPLGLAFSYEMELEKTMSAAGFWLPLAVWVCVLGLLLLWWRRAADDRRGIALAAAISLLTLAPVLNLRWLGADSVHDRYLYLPVLGVCLLAGLAVRQWQSHAGTLSVKPLAAVGLVSVLLLASTLTQETYCVDDFILWTHALKVSPNSDLAIGNVGSLLLEKGDTEGALYYSRKVYQRHPEVHLNNYNLAFFYYNVKNYPEAEKYLLRAMQIDPRRPDQYLVFGAVEMHLNRLDLAEPAMRMAIQIQPEGEGFHLGLGAVLLAKGDRAGAEREFREELRLYPDSTGARRGLIQATSGGATPLDPLQKH